MNTNHQRRPAASIADVSHPDRGDGLRSPGARDPSGLYRLWLLLLLGVVATSLLSGISSGRFDQTTIGSLSYLFFGAMMVRFLLYRLSSASGRTAGVSERQSL